MWTKKRIVINFRNWFLYSTYLNVITKLLEIGTFKLFYVVNKIIFFKTTVLHVSGNQTNDEAYCSSALKKDSQGSIPLFLKAIKLHK